MKCRSRASWQEGALLAGALLRFQCLDGEEARRGTTLHPSQPSGSPARADFALAGVKVGQARTGGEAGRLEMEQLRALLDRGRRHGTDRVGVDRPKTPASGNTAAVSHYKADNCPALAKTDLERGTPG